MESFVNNTHKEIDAEKVGAGTGKTSFTQIPEIANSTRQCDTPLSESIICRSFRDICAPETCAAGSIDASDNCQLSSSHSLIKRDSNCDEEKLDGQPYNFHAERNVIISEAALCNIASVTSQSREFVGTSNNNGPSDISNPSISREGKYQGCGDKELFPHQDLVEFDVSVSWLLEQGECFGNEINVNKKVKCDSNLTTQTNMKHNGDLDSVCEILGCYIHPMPILMVLLSTKDDEIYICVLCGSLMDKKWTLFIYKTSIQGQSTGYPSFIGYASIVFPVSRDAFGREVSKMFH